MSRGILLTAVLALLLLAPVAAAAGDPPAEPGPAPEAAAPAETEAPICGWTEIDASEILVPEPAERSGQYPCLPECRTSQDCDAICPPCPPFQAGFCNNEDICNAFCECFCS